MNRIESILIASPSNPRLKEIVRLRDRAGRDKTGLVLIEGYRELMRAVDAAIALKECYYCPELFLGSNELALVKQAQTRGAAAFSLSATAFRKISYRDRPDGLIATAQYEKLTLSDLSPSSNPLFLIAQGIEKPGNLGAILRSADAVGIDGVLVCDGVTDVTNPNVVRASTGTLFTVPVVETSSGDAFKWLREHGVKILAATPHAKQLYSDTDLAVPCAIAVGAEQFGLTEQTIQKADMAVRIPMAGTADSLNVSTAATLLLFEAARQRGFPPRNKRGQHKCQNGQ